MPASLETVEALFHDAHRAEMSFVAGRKDPDPARDQPGSWQVLTATELGAAHLASRVPNQDAVAAFPIGPCGAVAAVADGHGHAQHFRSEILIVVCLR